MATIQPISTTRVTEAMTRGRLTAQIQSDQLDLFRLQNQLSTGLRLFLPSDDAASAQRAMALQRTLERKAQSVTNLQSASASLRTTESALSGVSTGLNSLKSQALGVVSNFSSEAERQSVIETIDGLLFEFARTGNATFATNFLLGGAERSADAYSISNGFVDYLGDESSAQTYVDIGQLFDIGVAGDEVLGGFSEAVRGSADLNVQVTPTTPLSRLNRGNGVTAGGAVQLTFDPAAPSDPSVSAVVDLSTAQTIDDVARLLEAGAPPDANLVVSIEDSALRIEATGGGLTIGEVGVGRTAAELGILTGETPAAAIAGADLDPVLDVTTRLDDLVGSKARGRIVSAGDDNDLILTANTNGEAFNATPNAANGFNAFTVDFTDTAMFGAEVATYDPATNTLTVEIDANNSTADQVAAAINLEGTFTATPDYRDQTSAATRGSGVVADGVDLAVGVAGGVDGQIDLVGGLQITNGREPFPPIDTSSATTVEDLLNLLNDPQYGLLATINADGDGIDVRSRRSGADFTIGENGGTTATDLGIRTYTEATRLDDFNRGAGVFVEGDNPTATQNLNPFTISVSEDGSIVDYEIDPVGLNTVQDVIDRLAAPVLEGGTGGAVAASLATTGNGLVLTVTDPDSPASAASGSFTLGADTITIDALATGPAGNRPFTVEVRANDGAPSLATTVTGDTIVVDLAGATATTDLIAASIEAQLAGFTVTSSGTDTISAAVGPLAADTLGGAIASELADTASGSFVLNGDDLTFTADAAGNDGDRAIAVEIIDSGGAGPLLTTVAEDEATGAITVTVDLQGVATTTDAIASSIDAELATLDTDLPGFIVASSGTAAVDPADVPGFPAAFDASTTGGADADTITVSGAFAGRLGFLPDGEESVTSEIGGTLTSEDRHTYEVDSVFTTLIRMRDALRNGDEATFQREVNRIDDDITRVSFGRSEIGVRMRNLEAVELRLADEEVTLRDALSQEVDADLVEVISDFTLKQATLQAALQTSGAILNLSILDFI